MSLTLFSVKPVQWIECVAVGCVMSVGFVNSAYCQSQTQASSPNPATFDQLKKTELESIDAGVKSQKKIDTIDTQRRGLSETYRVTIKQHEDLKKYNRQLRELIRSQEEEAQSLKSQINRISNLERNVVPLMTDMLDTLENFVALDMPFLIEERRKRVMNLRALMSNANVTNSEKYRRILEAYQIENDYGRAIEAYEGSITDPAAGEQTVTFLKVGRVALLYQTLDGEKSYRWGAVDKSWQPLESDYNVQLNNGIKMAREQMPPNLLLVPVEAPAI
jgi:Protein of unknown function (DUF3450)